MFPRVVALTAILVLASATISFAADNVLTAPAPSVEATVAPPELVTVPDVRGQAYVFAKGTLEEQGFAWRVAGSIRGYAANTVVSQTPAAGTRVIDTGRTHDPARPEAEREVPRGRHARERLALLRHRDQAAPPAGCEAEGEGPPRSRRRRPAAKPKAKPAAKPKPRSPKREGEARREGEGEAAAARPKAFSVAKRTRGAPEGALAAGPREAAPGLAARAPQALDRQRAALALPARVDRHRREVRLVARRRGARDARPGGRAGAAPVGNRREERGRREARARIRAREEPMIMRLRRLLANERGYSLIELLQVTVILGVVLGALVDRLRPRDERRARDEQALHVRSRRPGSPSTRCGARSTAPVS